MAYITPAGIIVPERLDPNPRPERDHPGHPWPEYPCSKCRAGIADPHECPDRRPAPEPDGSRPGSAPLEPGEFATFGWTPARSRILRRFRAAMGYQTGAIDDAVRG